jgi:glycosyltransferase involved in cell wall biosynthesis
VASKLDLDILQAEQPVASIACVGLHDTLGIPIIADFHGIWAEEMVASNLVGYDDNYYKALFGLEQDIAQSADAITVVSKEMGDYVIQSFGVDSKKVSLVPNATFLRVNSAKVQDKPSKIIHSGTLHPWENVELFVNSMPYVLKKDSSARFFLTRKGAKLQKIMSLSESLGVNPEFFWYESGAKFFEFMKTCDIGVISSTDHIARKMAYPAKLYDYLSIGLPIVANDIGAWTNIIKDNKIGIVVDNSPEAYAEGILTFLQNPDLIQEYGQRGIELVKRELNYDKSAEMLVNLYNTLA